MAFKLGGVFTSIDLGHGITAHMRRPRASLTQEFKNRTPTFHHAFALIAKVIEGEEVDVSSVELPPSEVEAMAEYLARCTARIDGEIIGADGEPLQWSTMTPEDRMLLWDEAGGRQLMIHYGQFLGAVMEEKTKAIRDLRAHTREG